MPHAFQGCVVVDTVPACSHARTLTFYSDASLLRLRCLHADVQTTTFALALPASLQRHPYYCMLCRGRPQCIQVSKGAPSTKHKHRQENCRKHSRAMHACWDHGPIAVSTCTYTSIAMCMSALLLIYLAYLMYRNV